MQEDKHQTEGRRKVSAVIHSLNKQTAKLTFTLSRLKAFEDECFQKTIRQLKIGDRASATIYASEVAYLRRLYSEVKGIKDLMTQITLRLTSMLEAQHLTIPLNTLIETLKQLPHGLEADDLGQLTMALCDTAALQKGIEKNPQTIDLQTEDVLKEAESEIHKEYLEPLPS